MSGSGDVLDGLVFGIVVLEARHLASLPSMCHGIPVISGESGSWRVANYRPRWRRLRPAGDEPVRRLPNRSLVGSARVECCVTAGDVNCPPPARRATTSYYTPRTHRADLVSARRVSDYKGRPPPPAGRTT